ncbi:MAG: hypothetical protein U9N60_08960 [Thermodesulfobacteriota bacterium]|nr:hypothetical protein [Thermodesulfobacteriota bacterium]
MPGMDVEIIVEGNKALILCSIYLKPSTISIVPDDNSQAMQEKVSITSL